MIDVISPKLALLSVSDKMGLIALATGLVAAGVELVSTGGTYSAIKAEGIPVKDVSELTGFPEILDGRVKTLHPAVHSGLLAKRDKPEHLKTLAAHQLPQIDILVCNLYPFEATVAKPDCTPAMAIENIDIGGPTMIRAAAKNHAGVTVITSCDQYADLLSELKDQKGITLGFRQRCAVAAFQRIANYDVAIAHWFQSHSSKETFPKSLNLRFDLKSTLRYGENPHQQAALFTLPGESNANVCTAKVLGGKELSYNNLLDLDAALNVVRSFTEPAAVVIKHNNPCGAALASTLVEAFRQAYAGDPQSAFGGIIAFNKEVDEATAELLAEPGRFVEAIIAPSFTSQSQSILQTKPKWKDSVRLLACGTLNSQSPSMEYRTIDGGLLVQARDLKTIDWQNVQIKTKRPPTARELKDLQLAWTVVKFVKSNAIVLAKDGMVIGVGAGQMSRVDSVQIAIRKAGDKVKGAVLASDAFFPFRDNVDVAAAAGITAIAQPGGSVKDGESITACDEHNLAMVFTGVRHFRH